ncbi:hypothetical protein Q5M85_00065 [Paraclostridium bifermentans]|nr:hypothetical protein [Paraclostridium bifermentans]
MKVESEFNNICKDHRMRMLFNTDIESNVHYAESIFEVAKRNNIHIHLGKIHAIANISTHL